MGKKVAIALSGGIDSAYAAMKLKADGYDCVALYMRLGIADEAVNEESSRTIANSLGMDFYPVDFSQKFEDLIVNYYIESYKKGLTPNPCVRCNRMIKFAELLKRGQELGAEYIATGHYVRNEELGGVFKLSKGLDSTKDQSYFLYTLTQKVLEYAIFPLGEMKKEEVKEVMAAKGFPTDRPESQDVCFLNKDAEAMDHSDFLGQHIQLEPGDIVDENSYVLGQHKGLPLYTIGQRRGVELGGTGPYYVTGMDHKRNRLLVTNDVYSPLLFKDELIAGEVNWISGKEPAYPLECQAVIRYRHPAVDARVEKGENGTILLKFSEKQRAVTPGQSVVFYREDEVLGGGVIENL